MKSLSVIYGFSNFHKIKPYFILNVSVHTYRATVQKCNLQGQSFMNIVISFTNIHNHIQRKWKEIVCCLHVIRYYFPKCNINIFIKLWGTSALGLNKSAPLISEKFNQAFHHPAMFLLFGSGYNILLQSRSRGNSCCRSSCKFQYCFNVNYR